MLFTVWDAVRNGNIFARGLRNSVAHSYYLSDQNADKQTEIVGNARINGKRGQTWILLLLLEAIGRGLFMRPTADRFQYGPTKNSK